MTLEKFKILQAIKAMKDEINDDEVFESIFNKTKDCMKDNNPIELAHFMAELTKELDLNPMTILEGSGALIEWFDLTEKEIEQKETFEEYDFE